MALRPGSQFHRCHNALHEGPATTEEIAVETGFTTMRAGTLLYTLYLRGVIARSHYKGTGTARKTFGCLFLWMLPEHASKDAMTVAVPRATTVRRQAA